MKPLYNSKSRVLKFLVKKASINLNNYSIIVNNQRQQDAALSSAPHRGALHRFILIWAAQA